MIKVKRSNCIVPEKFDLLPPSYFRMAKVLGEEKLQCYKTVLEKTVLNIEKPASDLKEDSLVFREAYTLTDGSLTQGYFSIFNEDMEDLGKRELPNGEFEAGAFVNGCLLHGIRILDKEAKVLHSGKFEQGVLQGSGIEICCDSFNTLTYFIGIFKDGKRNSSGIEVIFDPKSPNDESYFISGSYEMGLRQGYFEIHTAFEDLHCNYLNDDLHGPSKKYIRNVGLFEYAIYHHGNTQKLLKIDVNSIFTLTIFNNDNQPTVSYIQRENSFEERDYKSKTYYYTRGVFYKMYYFEGNVRKLPEQVFDGYGKLCTPAGFLYEGNWNENLLEISVDPKEVDLPPHNNPEELVVEGVEVADNLTSVKIGYFSRDRTKFHGVIYSSRSSTGSLEKIYISDLVVVKDLLRKNNSLTFFDSLEHQNINLIESKLFGNKFFGYFRSSIIDNGGNFIEGTIFVKFWDGSFFEGSIRNSMPEGNGRYVEADGRSFEGQFDKGVFCGPLSDQFYIKLMPIDVQFTGIKYIVIVIKLDQDDSKRGEGYLLRNGHGEFYKGQFLFDDSKGGYVFDGDGEDRLQKNHYIGEFKQGRLNGIGKLTKLTYIMEGTFENSHLKDGIVRYDNHIGGAVLIKRKQNFRTVSREFEPRPDFTPYKIPFSNLTDELFTKDGWVLKYLDADQCSIVKLKRIRGGSTQKIELTYHQKDHVNQQKEMSMVDIGEDLHELTRACKIFGKIEFDKSARATYQDLQFSGRIINSFRHGYGTMRWTNGESYSGDFFWNLKHGNGLYIWPTGETYDGQYIMNQMNGTGVYYYNNGYKYEGEFRKDEFHGEGTIYNSNGDIILKGTWVYGEFSDIDKSNAIGKEMFKEEMIQPILKDDSEAEEDLN